MVPGHRRTGAVGAGRGVFEPAIHRRSRVLENKQGQKAGRQDRFSSVMSLDLNEDRKRGS